MSVRVKILLWLYLTGGLLTLLFEIAFQAAICGTAEPCHAYASIGKAAAWALLWPLSWGVQAAGWSFTSLLICGSLLLLLVAAAVALDCVRSMTGARIRIGTLLWLYTTAGLISFPFQVGWRAANCVGPVCPSGVADAALWSLFWPVGWGLVVSGVSRRSLLLAVFLLGSVLVISAVVDRVLAARDPKKHLIFRDDETPIPLRSELVVAALAFIALLAAAWTLMSVNGVNYAGGDGKMAQAIVHTIYKFGGWWNVTNLNPLQGIGSQMLPFNPWANPAYWPFAGPDNDLAPGLSGVMALACFALACYAMARCFDVPVLPSVIAAQLSIFLFMPIGAIDFGPVFHINPGLAIVYAPHVIALGVLARVRPGLRSFVSAAGGIFLLLLYSLYCDPLWTMVSGFGWAIPFAIVALSPGKTREVLTRFAVLGICGATFALTGPLEYLYTLSQYTARVQFSEVLSRPPSFLLASMMLSTPATVLYYGICFLGWFLGLLILRGRTRALVLTAALTFTCYFAYAGAFLLLPGNWWLPLPLYIEHCLIPLFTIAAVAGFWAAIRVLTPPEALQAMVRSPRIAAVTRPAIAALIAAAVIPGVCLLYLDRIRMRADIVRQPWPNEPELHQFLRDSIGLGSDGRFRGSVYFSTGGYDEFLTMNKLWIDSVPTANEYSQLVTPQSIYFIHQLFKKNLATELNWFRPWIGDGGSFSELFRAYRALGVRHVVSYEPLPPADAEHWKFKSFPRREPGKPPANWVVYEVPDINVGHYSPTEVTVAQSAPQIIAGLRRANFDFARRVVISTEAATPLVPARDMHLSIIRGGLHLSGRSDGTSLVLLPQQFSHCLRARDSRVRLVRANLMMTGVIFSGAIDTDITFDYGIFSPRCRRADLADVAGLGMKIEARAETASAGHSAALQHHETDGRRAD